MPDIKLQGYKYRQKKPQDIHQVNSKKTMVSLILFKVGWLIAFLPQQIWELQYKWIIGENN
jgi:hypothetical protein